MTQKLDYPWDEVIQKAREILAATEGTTAIFQKWTCEGCGNRLGLDIANSFHTHGRCDECATVTNIKARGCNYMIVQSEAIAGGDYELYGLKPPPAPGITIFMTSEDQDNDNQPPPKAA